MTDLIEFLRALPYADHKDYNPAWAPQEAST